MRRFFILTLLLLLLMSATHIGRVAAKDGWGLSQDFSNVTVRAGSARGGRVHVGGGFHGGK